ncbi:MAG TPA: asparagine synthase-related protein [Alphaproteobacteria bacterium]|nr:asparagine synthase-related protein [Alphaproteobacteria bacterium]
MTTGLCGWFGRCDGAPTVLQTMAGPVQGASHADDLAGVFVDTGYEGGGVFSDGRYRAALAGEPRWSDPDLAALSAGSGAAAALVEAFRRHRTELFRFLHGPFAFALHDAVEDESLLAIDRFGIHALCYADGAPLVFGTTADSVRRHPRITSTIDPQAIFNFLNFAVVPAPGTIYREQKKLLPAQYLHRAKGVACTGFYWQMPYRAETAKDPQALAEELMRLLKQAVHRAAEGVPPDHIGAFLSGGLDSSTVAGLLARELGGPARSFTMCFGAEAYDEVYYSRIAAKHFGLNAREHNLSPEEAVGVLETLAKAYDEPFGNSSAIPTFCCARIAAGDGVSVLLAGDGGDELFAGNSRYRTQLRLDHYFKLPVFLRKGLLEPLLAALPDAAMVGPVRKARNYVRLVTTPMPDRMLAYEHLNDDEVEAMFRPDFLDCVDRGQPMAIARAAYARPAAGDGLQRMMHLDIELALADNDLRKVRGMCRAAGVKVRFPFLDEDLANFSATLPTDVLMPGQRLRGFFKQAMQGFLPAEILDKKKHGFGMPYDLWIRSNPRVHQIVSDNVASFKRRAYCRPEFIARLMAGHASDDARFAGRLWDIMILEMWLRERGLS